MIEAASVAGSSAGPETPPDRRHPDRSHGSKRRVCVIGAGSSGITVLRSLIERNVEFECYEKGSEIGGNWRYENDNEMSAAYRSLHINTSRQMMAYEAMPMPPDYPDYPDHFQIAAYFDDFVDHFNLRDRIQFRTEVISVEPVPPGSDHRAGSGDRAPGPGESSPTGSPAGTRWLVTITDPSGETRTEPFTDVIVANGHHWDARWPEPAFPGSEDFQGVQMHAHDYRTPDIFEGKRVLVLGIGNSATDISVEASRIADATFLAMRRGAWILPKYIAGIPTDRATAGPFTRAPLWIQSLVMWVLLRLTVGKVTDYGLPKPDHRPLHAHPTVSGDLIGRLGHGDITVKPNLERLDGDSVVFTDGSREQIDVIIYCTGYRISFPFFDSDVVTVDDNRVDLYRRVVSLDHEGLYFIGLVQPLGSIMPLAEKQADWVTELISGEGSLPDRSTMARDVAHEQARMQRRYVASKRHTIQVDFEDYLREVSRERERSRARSRAATASAD